jgi:hypothetical protein
VETREACEAEAKLEEHDREAASNIPHPSKEEGEKPIPPDEEAAQSLNRLGRSGLTAVSKARAAASLSRFDNSDMWAAAGLGVSSASGCLAADKIDEQSSDIHIRQIMDRALHDDCPTDLFEEGKDAPGLHHEPCWSWTGLCCQESNKKLAEKYVVGLHRQLLSGHAGEKEERGREGERERESACYKFFLFLECVIPLNPKPNTLNPKP